jgi:hypothetical protein
LRKRKQPREERRRQAVEINLLDMDEVRGVLARARRGCSLPFFGGGLLILVLLGLQHIA